MKKTNYVFLSVLSLVMFLFVGCAEKSSMDLSGTWEFCLDRQGNMGPESEMSETIQLPGTTDTNRKGDTLLWKGETTHLSRPFSYK